MNVETRSVTRSYYRGAAGVILVYDITKSVLVGNLAIYLNRLFFLVAVKRSLTYPSGLPTREPWPVHILSRCWLGINRIVKKIVRWNGRRRADGQLKMVTIVSPELACFNSLRCAGVHFLEASSLTGDNVEAPFLLAARSILLSIESGVLDPEKAGSGVSYGDRALRRVTSSSHLSFGSLSGTRRGRSDKIRLRNWMPLGKCC